MTTNVGNLDRVLRVIVAVLLLGMIVGFHSWWGVLGIIPSATAAFGFCPMYAIVGWSSRTSAEHVRLL